MSSPPPTAPAVAERRWFDRREPLPLEDAKHRTTAFVYGNVVVLAALVEVSLHEITGRSVVVVLGTAVSTFLVHLFANVLTTSWTWPSMRREARNSSPILTSGLLPAALLLTTILFGAPSSVTVAVAQAVVIVQIALTGLVVARFRTEPTSSSTVIAGVALALLGMIVVVTKVVLT